MKSGRAVLFPVLKSTFERGDELDSDLQAETKFYKDHVIFWMQDIGRSLDYLDTRTDIVKDNFGYYGYSWGSAMGPISCVAEPRFKAAFFHVGGMMMQTTFPEVDPVKFHHQDEDTCTDAQWQAMIRSFRWKHHRRRCLICSALPEKDKKIIIYDGGHLVPKAELMKESLAWYDKYLGAVK